MSQRREEKRAALKRGALATIIIGSLAFSIGGAFVRLSDGFTKFWPSVIAACFVIGAGFLTRAVHHGGLSSTYVIGLGIEAVISVAIGLALLGERLSVAQTVGIAIIILGLVAMKQGWRVRLWRLGAPRWA